MGNKDTAEGGQKASFEELRLEHKVSVIDNNEQLIEDLNWQLAVTADLLLLGGCLERCVPFILSIKIAKK